MSKKLAGMMSIMVIAFCVLPLVGCGSQSGTGKWTGPSEIRIPWGDYEEEVYNLTANGMAAGEMNYIIEKAREDGKEVYKMQLPLTLTEGEYNSGTTMDAETLKPISSFYLRHPPEKYKGKRIDIAGSYKEKLEIAAESAKGKQNWQLGLSGECVDNESVPMIIRALPLKEGYKKVVNLAILSIVKVSPFEIRVAGIEKIRVPAGEYECYKVELQYKGLMPAPAIKFWFSADDKKLMVKSEQNATVFELKEVKYEKQAR